MRAWLKIVFSLVVVIAAVLGVLYATLFDVWTVPADDPLMTASIAPTLSAGDIVVLARHTSVGRGNLLRCEDPDAPGRFVVARAIGAPGDHLEMNDEIVILDGHRNPSPRACDQPSSTMSDPRTGDDVPLLCSVEDYGDVSFDTLHALQRPEKQAKATVASDRWYLVSDNRHLHLDSRDFGQIEPAACRHVLFRIVGAAGFGDQKSRMSIIW